MSKDLTTPLDDETERLIESIAVNNPESPEELAALLKTTEPLANAFAAQHLDEIRARTLLRQMDGKASVAAAQRIVRKAFERISAQMETADGHDAAELVKPALRVLETHEKARLAEREKQTQLPVFHITINKGGAGPAIQVRSMNAETLEEVEDVTPKVLGGEL